MKKSFYFILLATLLFPGFLSGQNDSLKVQYLFTNVTGNSVADNSGNGYTATLNNNASIKKVGDLHVLSLGTENGYLDMGTAIGSLISSLGDFTVSTYIYIDPNVTITGAGNFVWAFSTSAACGQTSGKYIAYRVNAQRYAQSTGGWSNEKVGIQKGAAATKGVWQHVVYTQSGTAGKLYVDGQVIASGTASNKPSDIGEATKYNWIGRPHFSADNYLKNTLVYDFRIYNKSLDAQTITTMASETETLEEALHVARIDEAWDELLLENLDAVYSDIKLPRAMSNGVLVSWASSNTAYISNEGFVKRPTLGAGDEAPTVRLTATLTSGSKTKTKEFDATVMPLLDDEGSVDRDLATIAFAENLNALRQSLSLPSAGIEGAKFSWKSDNAEYLSDKGEVLKFPAKGSGSLTVKLTVTATKGDVSKTREFDIVIPESEGYSAYMFAYFTGNTGNEESIRFALSNNGYKYTALNSGNPVIGSDSISEKKAVRDPHILRGHDGNTFYMVVTDMKSSNGWSSNNAMVFLKSTDLVNWTHSKVNVATLFPAFSTINRCWAPQTIYDEKTGKYMVYWSMRSGDAKDVIYYSYANDEFTTLETTPQVLFDYPTSTIDGDIIYKDGKYHMFFKTEGSGNGIKKAVSDNVTGPYVIENDQYLQQTTEAVEGSCVFKMIDSDYYILMYDLYTSGKYQFTESTNLDNFKVIDADVEMDFHPRHGTVIPITAQEAERLAAKWGKASNVIVDGVLSPDVKSRNIIINNTNKIVYVPVKAGTDITSFDPQLKSLAGVDVQPAGAQDFSAGAVTYTLSSGATTVNYAVTVAVDHNPVLDGYYADPEVLYSKKTGKYYIYPTSDGFDSWSGYYFKVFSSDDLVNWTDEGVIIDMHTDRLTWANGNAWAPCIIEKEIDGEYRYFYYFSGGLDGGAKKIGVAVASNPTGPFVASTTPLIYSSPTNSGQQIDPDVFTDPVTGKSYIYWGNGYMAGAELNDDMMSIKEGTIKVMTPNSTFREAVYVFYRDGKYYFTWSQDDTGSANYKVRYATSDSPLGVLTIPTNNIVIQRDDSKAIYGTGHNSILQIPNKDEWYVVYHRISRPKGITMSKPGNYREVCIDKMEFNADGSIKETKPTLDGVSKLGQGGTSIEPYAVEGSDKNVLLVYPNPVKDILNINAESLSGDLNVKVYNTAGSLVMSKNISDNKVDCSVLPQGVYVITVTKEGATKHSMFIKE
ncbi:T9SS C-terminal target domain-containing protein [Dysgonomonas sp. 216]|nr:T9SS C-terminal target domain-containing protein [Dysgonomonas sp. 216]